jgi:hypothetical protein
MLCGFLGFGTLWALLGSFMLRQGLDGLKGPRESPRWSALCVYQFWLPDGPPVRIQGTGPLHPELTDEPPQQALYDPADPSHARLFSQMSPDLSVSATGGWESPSSRMGPVRLALAILLVAGPLLMWLYLLLSPS